MAENEYLSYALMDINTVGFILTFLSFVITIPSFLIWLKSREPTIFLVVDYNINLFHQIIKAIDGLSINYNNVPVSEDSNLLKAFICYVGNQDIEKGKIDITVNLSLPENSKIITSKIIDKTEGLNITSEILTSDINFKFDLLKNKDLLYFEMFFESDSIINTEHLKLKSRIKGVDKHKVINYSVEHYKLFKSTSTVLFLGLIWVNLFPFFNDKLNSSVLKDTKNRFEKIIYYNSVIVNTDSLYKTIKIYNSLTKLDTDNISIDSLNHIINIQNSFLNYELANRNADSLLTIILNKEIDWTSLNTYNIFRS